MSKVLNQRGVTVWLTGLPCAGKSTIAQAVEAAIRAKSYRVEVLDGDTVRANLSEGLGYSKEDRDTNIRRIGFVANLLSRNGVVTIVAAISPYRQARDDVRKTIGDFIEVFVDCPLDVLIRRDVKGMYLKALRSEVSNFTGISDPYEQPLNPELLLHTDLETAEESRDRVISKLVELGYIDLEASSTTANPSFRAPANALDSGVGQQPIEDPPQPATT